jgi:hypothetical protein
MARRFRRFTAPARSPQLKNRNLEVYEAGGRCRLAADRI